MNTIFNATLNGVSLKGSTFYIYGLPPCTECSKGLIQAGVKRVVMVKDLDSARWTDSCQFARNMLEEAGVVYSQIEENE